MLIPSVKKFNLSSNNLKLQERSRWLGIYNEKVGSQIDNQLKEQAKKLKRFVKSTKQWFHYVERELGVKSKLAMLN